MDEKLEKYPKTDMFKILDTIGVPHPYCIGPKHVGYAADHCSGLLGKDAIIEAEKHNAHCMVKGCTLTFEEHKQGLIVEVKSDKDLNDIPELIEYLLSIKDRTEKDGFDGFAIKQVKVKS